jgi:hypothetical protein
MTKKKIEEASYAGNIGVMELVKFHTIASSKEKTQLKSHIANKKKHDAWKLIQQVTGAKLHKSVSEAQEWKSKAGAGEDGSDELVKKYLADTPGQNIASFKRYKKTK